MDKELESLNKDMIHTIENFSLNRYEMVEKLNTLIKAFSNRNRIVCLTSMRDNIIYLSFIVSDDIKKKIELDINLILRKNKIKKLRGM